MLWLNRIRKYFFPQSLIGRLEQMTSETKFGINSFGDFENVCLSKTIYYQLSVI